MLKNHLSLNTWEICVISTTHQICQASGQTFPFHVISDTKVDLDNYMLENSRLKAHYHRLVLITKQMATRYVQYTSLSESHCIYMFPKSIVKLGIGREDE